MIGCPDQDLATAMPNKARTVDINSEMAEGFALPPCGIDRAVLDSLVLPDTQEGFHPRHRLARHDEHLLPYVSSVSLACGAHSGDAIILQRTIPPLLERGIRIGAHPSYPDIFRFGQRRVSLTAGELAAVVQFQLGALGALLGSFGQSIQHVKCHGSLQFDVSYEPEVTKAVGTAIRSYDPGIVLVLMAGSPCLNVARETGVRTAEEAFLDRGYGADGCIVPRDHPHALLHDPTEAAERAVRMVLFDEGVSVDGKSFPLRADTFCIHSDTPNVRSLIAAIHEALRMQGVQRGSLDQVLLERLE